MVVASLSANPVIAGGTVVLRVPLRVVPLFVCCAVLISACGGAAAGSAGGSSSGKLQVVAGGELLGQHRQLSWAASKVAVQSIIVNPNTDPHSYEPTASDGVAIGEVADGDRERDRL